MLKFFLIRLLAVLGCACAVGAIGASGAAAAANPPGIYIGPIKVKHGYALSVSDTCTSKSNDFLTLEFSKGSKVSISHDYSGGASVCKISKTLGSGSLRAKWPGVATIKLAVKHPGKLTKPKVPRGCRGSGGSGRAATVTGTLSVSIHTPLFGKVNAHKAAATLDKSGNFNCATTGSSDVTVSGTFGQVDVFGSQPRKGQRSVSVFEPGVTLAGKITDTLDVFAVGGSKLFSAPTSLASAKFGSASPYLTGSLTFTALPECSATVPARNGTFSGTLVLHDPLSGNFKIVGSQASGAYIALGDATPGFCNGIGSTPASAGFTDPCTSASDDCSVSAMDSSNTVTFYDEANPGSVSIVSESWNFGDGSAPVSGPVGGSVTHTYTTAPPGGTYTVTQSVTTSQGQVLTSSQLVYIEP